MAERKKKAEPAPALDPTLRVGNIVRMKHDHPWANQRARILTEREAAVGMFKLSLIRDDALGGHQFYADPYYFTKVAEAEPGGERSRCRIA